MTREQRRSVIADLVGQYLIDRGTADSLINVLLDSWTAEVEREALKAETTDLGPGEPLWRVIMTDWANCSADVTITLRSGVQLTGRARKPGPLPGLLELDAHESSGGLVRRQVKHSIDVTEVAAITAKGTP